jgi:hypothetical protein
MSYDTNPNAELVQVATRGINVVHTAKPNTEVLGSAREALISADRTYFLGFGYNP